MGYRFEGTQTSGNSGVSVASAGDVDGDGLDDLLIGATGEGPVPQAGAVYLVAGADLAAADAADGTTDGVISLANIPGQENSYLLQGVDQTDIAGIETAGVGDIDGDGLDDILIGARAGDGADNATDLSGEAYLIAAGDLAALDAADGSTDGIIDLGQTATGATSYTFFGAAEEDEAGISVDSAGDFDGDGVGDFLIGANGAGGNGNGTGEVYAIASADLAALDAADGVTDGVIGLEAVAGSGAASYTFLGTRAGDQAGFSVSTAGDTDGDGLDDLLIGAPGTDGIGASRGETYLISSAELADADAADGTVDGIIDLDLVALEENSYRFTGLDADDFAGRAVAEAGDTDGDGLGDILIGANFADGGGVFSGEAYLISAADLADADAEDGAVDGEIDLDDIRKFDNSYRFIGTEVGDQAGIALSSAGDIDGDGLDDILIGAALADGGGPTAGEVYLIAAADLAAADAAEPGTPGVIDLDSIAAQANSYQFIGAEDGDQAGRAVSAAGDVDGDGIGDLLIGANFADTGEVFAGETYLLSGARLAEYDAADGVVDGVIDLEATAVICFVAGTAIETRRGPVPVEEIRPGDLVATRDDGWQPVRWTGVSLRRAAGATAPIRIRKGVLGATRDLWVSPHHRMLLSGTRLRALFGEAEVLASALSLVDGAGIARVPGVTMGARHTTGCVAYHHILCDRHQILRAEGTWSESFHPGAAASALDAPTRAELSALFPALGADYGAPARPPLAAAEAGLLR